MVLWLVDHVIEPQEALHARLFTKASLVALTQKLTTVGTYLAHCKYSPLSHSSLTKATAEESQALFRGLVQRC